MNSSRMATVYVANLLTNKDRRESCHRDEPPLVLDKGIESEDVHFTFIDIIPQITNSTFSFMNSNRTHVTYHKMSDLIKRANLWFANNQQWRIVNCETVLLFFKHDNGIWHLAAENSCFTLDMGAQSSLMALRLWIRRSAVKQQDQLSNGSRKFSHTPSHHERSKNENQIHYANHQATNYNNNYMTHHSNQIGNHFMNQHINHQTNHHLNQHTNLQLSPQGNQNTNQHLNRQMSQRSNHQFNRHLSPSPSYKRKENTDTNSADAKQSNESEIVDGVFNLKFRDFIPENREPGDHSKFEKLDKVVDKLNSAILNGELLAENVVTVESLYFPCECDWIIDNKLELTLHSFPSNHVCILRVFYIEYNHKPMDESLTSKLKKLNYAFRIQLKDFIPRTLSKGTFFKKPEFEKLSTCIKRASEWIEKESKIHQSKFQSLIQQLNNEDDHFLFDFKNAQCIEVKTKVLKHNIDSKIMAHSSNSGDYIRIFRVAYMEVISLYNEVSEEKVAPSSKKQTSSPSLKLRKSNLLSKSKSLIKSRQLLKSSSSSKSTDRCIDDENSFDDLTFDEDKNSTIHLSSIIFTPTNSHSSINEMKRKIQSWSLTHCRDDQFETDELAKYSRKPRLLSAETVEIFTKNFSAEEIEKETENCFAFNRIGTLNNFLYFSFRIYLDYLDGGLGESRGVNGGDHSTGDHNSMNHSDTTNDQARLTDTGRYRLKDEKCTII